MCILTLPIEYCFFFHWLYSKWQHLITNFSITLKKCHVMPPQSYCLPKCRKYFTWSFMNFIEINYQLKFVDIDQFIVTLRYIICKINMHIWLFGVAIKHLLVHMTVSGTMSPLFFLIFICYFLGFTLFRLWYSVNTLDTNRVHVGLQPHHTGFCLFCFNFFIVLFILGLLIYV